MSSDAQRRTGSLDMPRIAKIAVDGVDCMCGRAEKIGVSVAQLEGQPVVTLALVRELDGLHSGLYQALTPDEARAIAAALDRSADLA